MSNEMVFVGDLVFKSETLRRSQYCYVNYKCATLINFVTSIVAIQSTHHSPLVTCLHIDCLHTTRHSTYNSPLDNSSFAARYAHHPTHTSTSFYTFHLPLIFWQSPFINTSFASHHSPTYHSPVTTHQHIIRRSPLTNTSFANHHSPTHHSSFTTHQHIIRQSPLTNTSFASHHSPTYHSPVTTHQHIIRQSPLT
ncbi:mucin-3A [Biomphalaria glabrata]|nr:mucin-3A [Biomphalaria glabrata]